MIDTLLDKGAKYTGRDAKYLFYSKEFNQAVLIDFRPDGKGRAGKKRQFIVISYFPRGDKYARKDTKLVMTECHEKSYQVTTAFSEYLQSIISTQLVVEGGFGEVQTLIKDIDGKEYPCTVELYENKVWCLHEYEVIEIG